MNKLQILFDIILILIGLYIAFIKSYFVEKGKNLATKQDIGEITKEIETIRNEIDFNSQRKLNYHFDKKKAAIDFLSSISVWLDYAMRPLNTLSNNNTDRKIISDLISDLKIKCSNATNNYWSLFIYFEGKELTNIATELYNKCIELNNLTNTMLLSIERRAVEFEFSTNKLKYTNKPDEIYEIRTDLTNINKRIREIILTFSKDDEAIEAKAILLRLNYIVFLGELLKSNMNQQTANTKQ